MTMTAIRITKEQVMETETYKSLNKVLQKITLARNQIQAISHGLNVCKNIGYDKWEKQTNANWRTKQIIKELI